MGRGSNRWQIGKVAAVARPSEKGPNEKGQAGMRTAIKPPTSLPAWKSLETHHRKMRDMHLRTLFSDDAARGTRMTVEAAGIFLDYSKNRVTDETLALLIELA